MGYCADVIGRDTILWTQSSGARGGELNPSTSHHCPLRNVMGALVTELRELFQYPTN